MTRQKRFTIPALKKLSELFKEIYLIRVRRFLVFGAPGITTRRATGPPRAAASGVNRHLHKIHGGGNDYARAVHPLLHVCSDSCSANDGYCLAGLRVSFGFDCDAHHHELSYSAPPVVPIVLLEFLAAVA
ncbi:hypothetical protein HW555_014314 [Spodoptera exigua]|uniref:Uncharacterized protein n=1 Tax=Spodoptera exigua TaxID=7107 RepID=A0A835KXA7_SPOEX|nr:hypothetical protein HW555_014314 [Spodoptera exigua]